MELRCRMMGGGGMERGNIPDGTCSNVENEE